MDGYLEAARSGPLYLGQEAIARLVQASIHYGAQQLANHSHLLVLPRVAPQRWSARASHSGERNSTTTWYAKSKAEMTLGSAGLAARATT